MRIRFFQHLLEQPFMLFGGLVDIHGDLGLKEASTADAVVLS